MPDRLQEIRARLDAATPGQPWVVVHEMFRDPANADILVGDAAWQECIAHAPADIAWLLDEVTDLARVNVRLLAEVERLRDRNDSADATASSRCTCGECQP